MNLEEQVHEMVYGQVEMSPEMVEAGLSSLDNPERTTLVPLDPNDFATFILRKVSGLSEAVMLLARAMDERT